MIRIDFLDTEAHQDKPEEDCGGGAALTLLSGATAIVGLRLGMKVAEAEAAIRAYNPVLLLQPPVERVLQYRVFDQTRKTEPFASYVLAVTNKKQKDDIYIYFSPSEPRVVAIRRLHNNFDPPIMQDSYREALFDKYGEPDAVKTDQHADEAHRTVWYQWHIGEAKTQCERRPLGAATPIEGAFGSLGEGTGPVETGEVLQHIAPSGSMQNVDAQGPADCATLLTYQLAYDPLGSATGILVDVAAAAEAEQAMSAWIEDMVRQGEAEIQQFDRHAEAVSRPGSAPRRRAACPARRRPPAGARRAQPDHTEPAARHAPSPRESGDLLRRRDSRMGGNDGRLG